MGELHEIWVYLATSPLLGLTVTLLAYQLGMWLWEKAGRSPLVNPVLVAMLVLVGLLLVTDTDYATYFEGAQFVHFLLGPATVALAIPLYRQFHALKRSILAVAVALVAGSLTAAASAVGIAWVLGASDRTLLSLAPKSATSPIAMGVAEQVGGLPSLTAALVILTGIVGAVIGSAVLDLIRVKEWPARGFAMGLASHGIGTARALQCHEVAGAFAGLAMGLNGLATAILVPVLVTLLF
ncbi:LrgB family protein [Telmatospirillum sp. J64-1]|uniref:LrgB family protein n=1 Tax=Telmatospirillum sp. J64-1 TaxID=2502183 RepID=UPI00115D975D|nr:LrgB family protein [Telmatospirillum sp. J64-1]